MLSGARLRSYDPSVGEFDGAIAVSGPGIIVSDLDNRGSFLVQFFQRIHDHFALARMQTSGRLISEDQFGMPDDGAGDGDELLLAAG